MSNTEALCEVDSHNKVKIGRSMTPAVIEDALEKLPEKKFARYYDEWMADTWDAELIQPMDIIYEKDDGRIDFQRLAKSFVNGSVKPTDRWLLVKKDWITGADTPFELVDGTRDFTSFVLYIARNNEDFGDPAIRKAIEESYDD